MPWCVLIGFVFYIYLFREVKDQAQPTEKAGEKVLEELKNRRSKALSSYLILE